MNVPLSSMVFTFADMVQLAIGAAAFGGLYMKVNSIDAKVVEVKERQDVLETRHIQAIEKLGDALSVFADGIRSTVGLHDYRLKSLERFRPEREL